VQDPATQHRPASEDVPTGWSVSEHPELTRYRARNRRLMTAYAAAIVVLVVLALIGVRLAYAHGELDKVSFSTGAAPAVPATAAPPSQANQVWTTTDRAAAGDPYSEGVVVTYSAHTVNGRDALTGAVRWHYTRSDEVVCGLVQQDRSTIAIFERDGNCDEVTGFVTATGEPKWYRTLMDDGAMSLSSAPNVVLAVTRKAVHVFDNASGLDRWRWTAPADCDVDRALGGSAGVLTAYHCGTQHHLTLHDLTGDSEKWDVAVGEPYVPVAAGAVVVASSQNTGVSTRFSADKGAAAGAVALGERSVVLAALTRLPRSQTTIEGSTSDGKVLEIVWLGRVACLDAGGRVVWQAAAGDPASAFDRDDLAVTSDGTVGILRTADGRMVQRVAASGVRTGAPAFAAGRGVVVTGAGTAFYG
jgi:hypothetical protein